MLAPLFARIVLLCCNRARIVALAGLILGILAIVFTSQHFAMMTDSLELISRDAPWRKSKAAFAKAFPQESDLIVAVIDAATPELAESGAARLTARLSVETSLFPSVRRPDGGPFFARNGLLFLPTSEIAATTSQLIAAQPFLGPLAADPSLRGVMDGLSTALQGVQEGEARLEELDRPLDAFADALEPVMAGKPAFFSWQRLISGKAPSKRETRRIILIQPKLDNAVLVPGAPASDAIRQAARDLELDPAHGVRVRLTGSVMLADEELATLSRGAGVMTAAMIAAVLLMLWLAVRSVRIILCILATTFIGLALTAAFGLLAVGRLNLISVAFIPLFVGLGVDFAIQFAVRYRAERFARRDLQKALMATGATVGGSLALAAGAMAAGFFAFLPTSYLGASELGLIAGIGMIIAFVLSLTFLPALLTLARPGGEAREIGFTALAPVDRYLMSHRKLVLGLGGIAAVICLVLLPSLGFDFNPLHLRNPHTESVSTLSDLMADRDRTPNTIDVLAPSLAAADQLGARLSTLPEIGEIVSLRSFIPADQPEKLALLGDALPLLDLTLHPIDVKPAPTDAQTAESLTQAASALRRAARNGGAEAARKAQRLADILDRLAAGTPDLRDRASQTMTAPLAILLDQLRAAFEAAPVTLQSLPPDLVRDWIAGDGRARLQVFPGGDSNDNRTLRRFAKAVQAVVPDATGTPISIQEAARSIVDAFLQAGLWSFLAITILLACVLRRLHDVVVTVIPILLSGLLTLASCILIDLPLNFANIIALPLLFGIGVAFNIYFVMAWRSGQTHLLQSSLSRAVLFSALTTTSAFAGLLLSSHPGTASLGKLLVISLGWTSATALLFEPALLGPATETTARRSRARWPPYRSTWQ